MEARQSLRVRDDKAAITKKPQTLPGAVKGGKESLLKALRRGKLDTNKGAENFEVSFGQL